MNNLYDYVLKFQQLNEGKLCIFRVGFFYCTFGVQTYLLEEKFGLLRTCFIPDKVCKVGMPKDAINKYISMLKSENISFCIYDYVNDDNSDYDFKYKIKKYKKTVEYDSRILCDFSKYSIDCSMCKSKKGSIYLRLDLVEKILLSIKSDISKSKNLLGDMDETK